MHRSPYLSVGRAVVSIVVAALFFLGLPLQAANADGSSAKPLATTPEGSFPSTAIDASGRPVVAYSSGFHDSLKVAVCLTPSCDDVSTTIVDGSGSRAYRPSMVLNDLGHPVISHVDGWRDELNLTTCGDPRCVIASTVVVAQGQHLIGDASSLTLNAAGNPVIAFRAGDASELRLAVCGDPGCADASTSIVVTGAPHDVLSPELALDSQGNPVISYLLSAADGHDDVMVAVCSDPTCTTVATTVVDGSGRGYAPSIVVDESDHPAISYHTRVGDLRLTLCGNSTCSASSTILLETGFAAGDDSSLVLDGLGNPAVAYDRPFDALVIAQCANSACAQVSTTAVDASTLFGAQVSLAVGATGEFAVAYQTKEDRDLTVATLCAAENFVDVPSAEYYSDAVAWASCTAVTAGTSATTFGPDAPVTRGQLATFLWRSAGEPAGSDHGFADVAANSYYEQAVAWLAATEVTAGTSATTFGPDAPVTRGQLATFLWRLAGEPAGFSHGFADVAAGSFYEQAVGWMVAADITAGTSATTFAPDEPVNRAQAVTFLWRYTLPR